MLLLCLANTYRKINLIILIHKLIENMPYEGTESDVAIN